VETRTIEHLCSSCTEIYDSSAGVFVSVLVSEFALNDEVEVIMRARTRNLSRRFKLPACFFPRRYLTPTFILLNYKTKHSQVYVVSK